MNECGFTSKPRELTQYSLRHQGINALLMQGVAPTKVADLAGHSLAIQQKIYKKYSLEDDHTVLKNPIPARSRKETSSRPTFSNHDLPYPWEVDTETSEAFNEEP